MTEYKEFEEELESLVSVAKEALKTILLSEDRTSKHPPYTWQDVDVNDHIFKAVGHIMYGIGQYHGYKKHDGEDHIHNAITRLLFAKWLIDNKIVVNCPNCNKEITTLKNKRCNHCIDCGCQYVIEKQLDGIYKTERFDPFNPSHSGDTLSNFSEENLVEEKIESDTSYIILTIRDYITITGPGLIKHGHYSGEWFAKKYLYPKFKKAISAKQKLLIDLDGTQGYSAGFLMEVFGSLSRIYGSKFILSNLLFKTSDEPELENEIKSYIVSADKVSLKDIESSLEDIEEEGVKEENCESLSSMLSSLPPPPKRIIKEDIPFNFFSKKK